MNPHLGWRLIVGLVLGGIVLLQRARCQGAGDARRAREKEVADSAASVALHRVGTVRRTAQAAGRVYIGTGAPHVDARGSTDRQVGRSLRAVATADSVRTAAERVLADSGATLKQLHVELRRSADVIGMLEVQVVALVDTLLQARAAVDVREKQLQRPWWRRALSFSCQGGTTAGTAGLGAMAGGPGGAMVGAVVGVIGSHVACR